MIDTIRSAIKDPKFEIQLKPEWSSNIENYRQNIRKYIASQYTSFFKRESLALLSDLNKIPESEIGFFSISHCPQIGGFSYSQFLHGFDIEQVNRISDGIIRRTTTQQEYESAPQKHYLWAAKEAAFKALGRPGSAQENNLIITDLSCVNWNPQFGLDVWNFQIQSDKDLVFEINKGFVFEEKGLVFSVFFR